MPSQPATPRPAASLLVVRYAAATPPTILMARRSAGHRFMPNVLVFPGGAVDPGDHAARSASPLAPQVLARLHRQVPPGQAAALAGAAARELTEEVGLCLGVPPALAALDYLCRAITPPDRSIRFDAHFFIVDAAHVSGTPAASVELEAPGWYTVEQALQAEIAAPTRAVLGRFARWLAGRDRDGPVPVLRDRVWHLE